MKIHAQFQCTSDFLPYFQVIENLTAIELSVGKINATISKISELLHSGIPSEDIMSSYRSSLKSSTDMQLNFPLMQKPKQANINKEDIEELKMLPNDKLSPDIFANISHIDEQMSLISVAQRISNATIIEDTIKDEIATTNAVDFLHTVGLKALLVAISSTPQPCITIQDTSPYVQAGDLSVTNTQTMVAKLLQTCYIVCKLQVRIVQYITTLNSHLFSIIPR